MKECPVCHAKCFDDMEICYGCLSKLPKEIKERPKDLNFPLSVLSKEGGGYRLTIDLDKNESNYLREALLIAEEG